MVIPVDKAYSSNRTKKYVGNNLTLEFTRNNNEILIVGNNCKLTINENSGLVKVIGDNCEVNISKCTPAGLSVDYVGNNGRINFGCDISEESVTYVGNCGEITSRNIHNFENKYHYKKFAKNKTRSEPSSPKTKVRITSRGSFVDLSNLSNIQLSNFAPEVNGVLPNVHVHIGKVRSTKPKP